jgi:hypothetical protein
MKGEFKSDNSRDTFDIKNRFNRVILQQGRVLLDSDWNEQTDILLHYLQTFVRDVLGDHGGPDDGFKIENIYDENYNLKDNDFAIRKGRYYVDGILCENMEEHATYLNQNDYYLPEDDANRIEKIEPAELNVKNFLVYIDVWERHLSFIEEPGIREVALGGADTSARSKVVWQVKICPLKDACSYNSCEEINSNWNEIVKKCLDPANEEFRECGRIIAKAENPKDATPCILSPESKYRGNENQLYRVEIHRSGTAFNVKNGEAAFKWSRENGSIVFSISAEPISSSIDDKGNLDVEITLNDMRCCSTPCLSKGDWVEFINDDIALKNIDNPLWQVTDIDGLKVKLRRKTITQKDNFPSPDKGKHPMLRRWDQKEKATKKKEEMLSEGAMKVIESDIKSDQISSRKWLDLENGIKILFPKSQSSNGSYYRRGDYWLIPARTATGGIEWPLVILKDNENKINPAAMKLPHGIRHHYAPLAIISKNLTEIEDCRKRFDNLCSMPLLKDLVLKPSLIDVNNNNPPIEVTGTLYLKMPAPYIVKASLTSSNEKIVASSALSNVTINQDSEQGEFKFTPIVDLTDFNTVESVVVTIKAQYSGAERTTFLRLYKKNE